MSELCDASATELLEQFESGAVSPVEVMESVLHRMDAAEPHLCATWLPDHDGAMAAARASEDRWRRKTPVGPLDGVPVTIKEMIATKGAPKPVGTAAGDMTPQAEDAPPAARLREAGAIPFAKTTNPDFGMLSSGLSSFHKLARNPWDLSKTPGGSSAGAAAAAAAGYGPLHLGTDIGGSIRLPAGWCGVFGLKPSLGRVPIDPPYIGRVAGPMTRTVADAALMMRVLSLPDDRDYMSLPFAELDWIDLKADVRGLKIALQMDAGCGIPVEPETAAAVERAAAMFEAAGAIVERVDPFLTAEMLNGLDRFWRARFLDEMARIPEDRHASILPYIRAWVEGARSYSGQDVYTGFNQIMIMRMLGQRQFAPYDYLLSPVSPVAAFPAELPSPLDDPDRPFEHIGFTVAWNMTEQPAASINCGYTAQGLPIGLQIVGRRFDDVGVLRLSHAFEAMRGEQRPWPVIGKASLS